MLRLLDLRNFEGDYRAAMPRAAFDVEAALTKVAPICEDVALRGAKALEEYSLRFDQVLPDSFRVPQAAIDRAEHELDPQLRRAFAESIARRRQVAASELPPNVQVQLGNGAVVEQWQLPISRVGLYVPGGLAPLSSSVLMNVIPAQVAKVESIAVASPPQREFGGLPHPTILAMCKLLGVDEVYAVGGAQAIAMFAYGVEGVCPPVDMVTGPGNIYVVAAKRYLSKLVGIDSEAGPTEIAILANDTANPTFIAADLVSQAEHDPLAAAILVSDSIELIEAVQAELQTQVAVTKYRDRVLTALTGEQSAFIRVRDIAQGIDVVNAYGAEHLEIQTCEPRAVAQRIKNAGAIFLGSWSPVSLGDYSAGSTHVLPTRGCACHSSGLNVKSFLKAVHVVDYSQSGFADIAEVAEKFAAAEDLPAHRNAIVLRRTP
ncbi:MAG: histidinol dehydrogenase [Propionibacteriaceae bacterium]|nr:histidinol dehydrogenase [Propionibacteriaceae bacterium]